MITGIFTTVSPTEIRNWISHHRDGIVDSFVKVNPVGLGVSFRCGQEVPFLSTPDCTTWKRVLVTEKKGKTLISLYPPGFGHSSVSSE